MQNREKRPPISLEEKEKEKGFEPGTLSYAGKGEGSPGGKKRVGLALVQGLLVLVAASALSIYATTQLAPSKTEYVVFTQDINQRLVQAEKTQGTEMARVARVVDTMGEYAKSGKVREFVELARTERGVLDDRIFRIEQALLVKTSGVEVSYYSPFTIKDAGSYPISLTVRNHSVEAISSRIEFSLTPSMEAGLDITKTSLFVTKTPNFKWGSTLSDSRLVFSSDDVNLRSGETFIELTLELAYIEGEPQAKWFPGVIIYR